MKSQLEHLSKIAVITDPDNTIDAVSSMMTLRSGDKRHTGLAFVVEQNGRFLGILSESDVRRTRSRNISFTRPVREAMNSEPLTLPARTPNTQIVTEIYHRLSELTQSEGTYLRHIPMLDDSGVLIDVLDVLDLLKHQNDSPRRIAVIGMGYVGLTLSVSLASRGHIVTGVDVQHDLVRQLMEGRPHVHEPGLREMLDATLACQLITFHTSLNDCSHDVYIIAVGTPLDQGGKPDLSALHEVTIAIGPHLRHGDLVMLRSTVPTGTTRNMVVQQLEALSGLTAGEEFHVAFAPERTIEGRAMYELCSLPQVLGGLSSACLLKAAMFWSTVTPSIIQVASLEASELVKLANNTFRDLSFAFANEVALLADASNINAFELLQAANAGYQRNPIPLPSPGVGGYCLTKDPLLYGYSPTGVSSDATLGIAGRRINEKAGRYPLEIIKRYANRIGAKLHELTVVVIGIAFKGEPETSDVRGSVALDVIGALDDLVSKVVVWDAVIDHQELIRLGLDAVTDWHNADHHADVILILNNHRSNVDAVSSMLDHSPLLIFDGWNQLNPADVECIPGLTYATMGYMTKHEQ